MVLARSMSGTIRGHAPIISIHDTWYAEAHGSHNTIWGWPQCPVDYKPTSFVTDETQTDLKKIDAFTE